MVGRHSTLVLVILEVTATPAEVELAATIVMTVITVVVAAAVAAAVLAVDAEQ